MMKATKLVSCAVVAVLLAGCVPLFSLHPLYTKETLTFDEKLLGTWVAEANKPETTWEFARLEEGAAERLPAELRDQAARCYRVNFADEKGKGSLVACLVKLNDRLFLDLFPDKFPSGEQSPESMKFPYNAIFFLRLHTFVRVTSLGDQLKIRLTDDEGFKKLLDAEPKAVAHDTVEEQPILTAPTDQLQAFMTKYANDDRLLAEEMTLRKKTDSTAQ